MQTDGPRCTMAFVASHQTLTLDNMDASQWLEEFNRILCEGDAQELFDMYRTDAKILHFLSEYNHTKSERFMEFCRWFIEQDPCLDFKLTEFDEVGEGCYLITGKYILRTIQGDDFCRFSMLVVAEGEGQYEIMSEHVSPDETYMN